MDSRSFLSLFTAAMKVPPTLRAGDSKSKPMDKNQTENFVNEMWDDSIIPELCEYIKIPNKSPMFDPDWEQHGYMDQAVQQFDVVGQSLFQLSSTSRRSPMSMSPQLSSIARMSPMSTKPSPLMSPVHGPRHSIHDL